MKRIFLSILVSLLCAASVFAQGENKHQLALGVGMGTMPQFKDFALTLGTLGDTSYENASGAFTLQYLNFVKPKLGLGAIVSIEHMSGVEEKGYDGLKKDIAETEFVIMPAISFYYYRNHVVGIYGKAAVGVDVIAYSGDTKEAVCGDDAEFAFQISPAGVDVGGEHWRFYTEFGLGYQGIVNMGVHYSF